MVFYSVSTQRRKTGEKKKFFHLKVNVTMLEPG